MTIVNFDEPPFPPVAPFRPRPRINLTALYGLRVDLRLHVCPGDEVICDGEWAVVKDVRLRRRPSDRHPRIPVKRGWDGIEIVTTRGSRWFGYPSRTLPSKPVTRKRPLW